MSNSIQSTEKTKKKQKLNSQDTIQEVKKVKETPYWRHTLQKEKEGVEEPEKEETPYWRRTLQDEKEIKEEELEEPGMLESAVRGGFDGASFGFLDELAGGLEAAGSTLGVRGLGESFGDIRWETEEEDEQSLEEIYEEARDKKRELSEASREANPVSHTIGEIGGGMAVAGPLLNGTNTVKQAVKVGAIDGGLSGAGYSEADSVGGVLKDTAIGGAAGAALGGGMAGAGKALKKPATKSVGKVTEKFNKFGLGLDEDVTKKIMKNPQSLKGVKKASDIESEITDTATKLKGRLKELHNEAMESLDNKPLKEDVKQEIQKKAEKLVQQKLLDHGYIEQMGGVITPGPSRADTSLQAIEESRRLINQLKDQSLSEKGIRKIVDRQNKRINNLEPELKDAKKFLKESTKGIEGILRETQPAYKQKMEQFERASKVFKNAKNRLNLEYKGNDLIDTPETSTKLQEAGKSFQGDLPDKRIKETLTDLSEYSDVDHLKDIEQRGLMDRASGGPADDSRDRWISGIVGGVPGAVLTGTTIGTGVAGALSVGGKILRDKYGRTAGRKLSQLVGELNSKYGKYFDAASAGTRKPAINHFLLYNKDPEYRDKIDRLNELIKEGRTIEEEQEE